jgi:hypothetical protein
LDVETLKLVRGFCKSGISLNFLKFHDEIFILEEDELAHYREAMAAPSSKEWLVVMHTGMKIHIQLSLELG